MRPPGSRNDSRRRDDDRRRDVPPPDDRGLGLAPARGNVDDRRPRRDDARGRRPRPAEPGWSGDDQAVTWRGPAAADPYDPYGPDDPYATGRQRFAAGDDSDPYRGGDDGPTPRERFRDDRGSGRRPDRSGDERPAARPPARPRYGVITPSDELAWPDAEPAEAEWRPARPGRGRADDRPRDTGSRRPDVDRGDRYEREPGDWPSVPAGRRARVGGRAEPADQWSDDLAYDIHGDEPVDYEAPRDDRSGWYDDREDRSDPEREPTLGDDDPAGDWTGAEEYEAVAAAPARADDPRAVLFAAPERPPRRSTRPGDGVRPTLWEMTGYAWRFARKLTIARTNRLLRFGASRVLPASSRARFEAMHLPQTEVDETLAQIRSLDDWAEAWTGTAQRFLGETRRGGDMTPVEAARSRQLAALCYHVASFFAFGDERLARTSRSASTTLFAQSVGLVLPETRQVNVRWRSKTMPGYLTVPSWATGRRPLVVLLNGATTSREELILWSEEFLAQGLAVLALDTPGFGQGSALGPVGLDNDDIVDGIVELAEADPGLDPEKISLAGVSLGGTMALRAAAGDRRVSAVVAVTPLHEPARWLGASSQVSLAQIVPLFGGYDQLADFVLGLDMAATLAATEAQVLVFGAGRDLVVPPPEASRLAAALGEQATLVWFEDAGHALFDAVPEWTREAAEWLAVVMDVDDAPIFTDQHLADEPGSLSEAGRTEPDAGEMAGSETSPDDAVWDAPRADGGSGASTTGDDPPARPSGWRQPVNRRGNPDGGEPGSRGAGATPGSPPPEPYGAAVFNAGEAEQRRTGQQRGYETGAFGPLGPAAARILANEPTPEPGSADWGYEDGNAWTERDPDPAWSDSPARHAPSTARLWADRDEPVPSNPTRESAAVVPRSALDRERSGSASGSTGSSGDPLPDGGTDLPPAGPAGPGRSSAPSVAVPGEAPAPLSHAGPPEAAEPDDAGMGREPGAGMEPGTPGAMTSGPGGVGPVGFRPRMAGRPGPAGDAQEPNAHAPFRPPADHGD